MKAFSSLLALALLAGCSSSDGASGDGAAGASGTGTPSGPLVTVTAFTRTPYCTKTGDTITITWSAENADACSFQPMWFNHTEAAREGLPTSGTLSIVVPNALGVAYGVLWCYHSKLTWSECYPQLNSAALVSHGGDKETSWSSKAGSACGWAQTNLINSDYDFIANQAGCPYTGKSGTGGSSGGTGGSGGNTCSSCLQSCRGMSGCCTGTGCICESAC